MLNRLENTPINLIDCKNKLKTITQIANNNDYKQETTKKIHNNIIKHRKNKKNNKYQQLGNSHISAKTPQNCNTFKKYHLKITFKTSPKN